MDSVFIESVKSIFGTYIPNTYTDYLLLPDGTLHSFEVIPSGIGAVDFDFIIRALLIFGFLYVLVRTMAGFISLAKGR